MRLKRVRGCSWNDLDRRHRNAYKLELLQIASGPSYRNVRIGFRIISFPTLYEKINLSLHIEATP
jgi:hypothetical protein